MLIILDVFQVGVRIPQILREMERNIGQTAVMVAVVKKTLNRLDLYLQLK